MNLHSPLVAAVLAAVLAAHSSTRPSQCLALPRVSRPTVVLPSVYVVALSSIACQLRFNDVGGVGGVTRVCGGAARSAPG